jgi:hypothetical protein
MMVGEFIDLLVPPFMVVLAAWFYPHRARPNGRLVFEKRLEGVVPVDPLARWL